MMRTKAEEIQMLQEWYQQAHEEPDSYLAGLMTQKFVEHVHAEIVADRIPDIHAELEDAHQATAVARLPAQTEIRVLRHQLQERTIERNKLARDLASMSLNWKEERDKVNREYAALESKIFDAECEINRLKALLWDAHEAQKED